MSNVVQCFLISADLDEDTITLQMPKEFFDKYSAGSGWVEVNLANSSGLQL